MRRKHPFVLILILLTGLACRTITGNWLGLSFSPEKLPAALVGQPYSETITITNNETPVFLVSLAEGELPPGLVVQYEEGDTATISGIPEEAGSFDFSLEAMCYGTNKSGQTGEKSYEIIVIDPNQFKVRAGTQLRYDNLEIGIGNIWEESYSDENGVEHMGLTAGIWIQFPEDPSLNQTLRAHLGQVIMAEDYRIEVKEVVKDEDGDYVILEIVPKPGFK